MANPRTFSLPVLIESRDGYRNLCRLITTMKMRAAKGEGALTFEDLDGRVGGLIALAGRTAINGRRFGVGGLVDRIVGVFDPDDPDALCRTTEQLSESSLKSMRLLRAAPDRGHAVHVDIGDRATRAHRRVRLKRIVVTGRERPRGPREGGRHISLLQRLTRHFG